MSVEAQLPAIDVDPGNSAGVVSKETDGGGVATVFLFDLVSPRLVSNAAESIPTGALTGISVRSLTSTWSQIDQKTFSTAGLFGGVATLDLSGLDLGTNYNVTFSYDGQEITRPLAIVDFDTSATPTLVATDLMQQAPCYISQTNPHPYPGSSTRGHYWNTGDAYSTPYVSSETDAWLVDGGSPNYQTGFVRAGTGGMTNMDQDYQAAAAWVHGDGVEFADRVIVDVRTGSTGYLEAATASTGGTAQSSIWLGLWDYDQAADDWAAVKWALGQRNEISGGAAPSLWFGTVITIEDHNVIPGHTYYAALYGWATTWKSGSFSTSMDASYHGEDGAEDGFGVSNYTYACAA